MKALTLYQPHATLCVTGAKKVETRAWATRYRGPLAIHASMLMPKAYAARLNEEPFLTELVKAGVRYKASTPQHWYHVTTYRYRSGLVFGAILGTVDLVDCYEMVERAPGIIGLAGSVADDLATPMEMVFGDWQPGRYAWLLANPRRLATPIPCRGNQRLWTPRPDVLWQLTEAA